jgi:ribosome recycling factor
MNDGKQRMEKAARLLSEHLAGIRPGALSVGVVETIRVAYPRGTVSIGKPAAIGRQGDRIVVTPFDPAAVPAIVKALTAARLNAYALNPKTVCVGGCWSGHGDGSQVGSGGAVGGKADRDDPS